ncbi:dihydrofolate reductase [uncultured Cohaesibacter sp.]|uniref:dihydrofolate reductase n=1 Tax=uncultured Cohaesibacter sp. TaxID=1002546 RepID=UPI0029C88033|nr:dihydrofolate reductase [uncultured Cohaesibacter sp.]
MSKADAPKLVFHYAVADNGVIGKDNDMPWHVSTDLKRFKAMTMGKPLIMGRMTFQSIGRPLPGRTNIVVTRDESFDAKGVVVASSIEAALEKAREIALGDGVDEIAVIGGGTIYNALWEKADRLYVTHVHAEPEGDTFLPQIDPAVWKSVSNVQPRQGEKDSAPMSFSIYERFSSQND